MRLAITNSTQTNLEFRFETTTQRESQHWPHVFVWTLITILEGTASQPVCFPAATNLYHPQLQTTSIQPTGSYVPSSTMNPAFNHRRHRGWRNSQFHHATGSPFQVSYQTTYQNLSPPPPMPLPPPIPPAASLPITYYDTNGSYYHASQYNAVQSPWNENMGHYAPDPQQLLPGYYDNRFSVPPTQNTGYHLQHKSDNFRCPIQPLLLMTGSFS